MILFFYDFFPFSFFLFLSFFSLDLFINGFLSRKIKRNKWVAIEYRAVFPNWTCDVLSRFYACDFYRRVFHVLIQCFFRFPTSFSRRKFYDLALRNKEPTVHRCLTLLVKRSYSSGIPFCFTLYRIRINLPSIWNGYQLDKAFFSTFLSSLLLPHQRDAFVVMIQCFPNSEKFCDHALFFLAVYDD